MIYLIGGLFGGLFGMGVSAEILSRISPPEPLGFITLISSAVLSAALGVAFIARVTR